MVHPMNHKQVSMLIIMSAIWGASFVFMKVLVPVLGPIMTSSLRLLSAAIFLYFYLLFTGYKMSWKGNIKNFIIIGVFNSAIPFTLYSFAAIYIPSNIEVIINSTSPMFGALFAYVMLKDRLNKVQVTGLLFGIIGVAIVSNINGLGSSVWVIISLLACLVAAALYGFGGTYIKKYAMHIDSKMMTLGSLLFAAILLLPFSFFYEVTEPITWGIIGLLVGFGVLGTAVTYLLYYALIKQVGATKALTVTYLMPIFGVLWSYIFINEIPTIGIYIGAPIILLGVFLTSYSKTEKL